MRDKDYDYWIDHFLAEAKTFLDDGIRDQCLISLYAAQSALCSLANAIKRSREDVLDDRS